MEFFIVKNFFFWFIFYIEVYLENKLFGGLCGFFLVLGLKSVVFYYLKRKIIKENFYLVNECLFFFWMKCMLELFIICVF